MIQTKRYWLYASGAGICAGLMGLVKPEYALLGLFVLMSSLIIPALRKHWRGAVIVAVISLLFVSMWQIRNQSVDQPKNEVLVANKDLLRPYVYPALHGIWWYPVTNMEELEAFRKEDREYFRLLKNPAEAKRQAIAVMKENPFGVAKLIISRTMILWFSPPNGTTLLAEKSDWLKWAGVGIQYMYVSIGLFMLIVMARIKPEILPLLIFAVYMTAVYGLLHSIRRYGYPFIPELSIFASWGCWVLWTWCREKMFSKQC
jgi:hypothetical protein